ncbi:hypothetical protein AAVH_41217 [Aphelenchoides avenae]|nr:hypothetical protein AAVH_41217 [Aphelenchus avenae]
MKIPFVPRVLLLTVGIVSSDVILTQQLRTYRDESYGLNVVVGTPNQSAFLRLELFDNSLLSMNAEISLAGAACKRCCRKSRYDLTKSTTSECDASTERGDAQMAKCQDAVSVLGTTYKEFPFYEVTAVEADSLFLDKPWDGAFVVMRRSIYSINGLDIVGLYMKRTCSSDFADYAGTISADGIDPQNCGKAGPAFEYRSGGEDAGTVQLSAAQVDSITLPGGPWRAGILLNEPVVIAPKVHCTRK